MANAIGPVRDVLIKSGLEAQIGQDHSFMSLMDAYQYAEKN